MDKLKRNLSLLKKAIWISFAALWLIFIGLFIIGRSLLPSFRALDDKKPMEASVVYSEDGIVLGKYFDQNRVPVTYEEISPYVITALLATEDVTFYGHSGISLRGLLRAFFNNLRGGSKQGASTLTMQLARNLYDEEVGQERSIKRKIKEIVCALYIERNFTKKEIITLYLNTVPWGGTTYGIHSASKMYFSKHPKYLQLDEAALLVGILKGASYYNPFRYGKRALERRNVVIQQLLKYNLIDRSQAENIKKKPTYLRFSVEDHNEGLAAYFREHLRDKVLKKWARESGYNLYHDGLKIYTTINSKMQQYAEEAIYEHVSYMQKQFDQYMPENSPNEPWNRKLRPEWNVDTMPIYEGFIHSERYRTMKAAGATESEIRKAFSQKLDSIEVFTWVKDKQGKIVPGTKYLYNKTPWDSVKYTAKILRSALVAIEPNTRYVRAWVGGIGHHYFKYDQVANGKRQVGSAFKPFVYAAAIINGVDPCEQFLDAPYQAFDKQRINNKDTMVMIWAPKNADGKFRGMTPFWVGLKNSINTVTARIMYERLGGINSPNNVATLAENMGITSKLERVLSLALGTTDLTILELTNAYATFANRGIRLEPILITKITDRYGNEIPNPFTQQDPKNRIEAISPSVAYKMCRLLQKVVVAGTASGAYYKYQLKGDIGGKTGTTQKNSDAWFIGFSPKLAIGVWFGCESRGVHFNDGRGQGGQAAAPTFAIFYKKCSEDPALRDKIIGSFSQLKPANDPEFTLDCNENSPTNYIEEFNLDDIVN
ncbi:MAG: transglycosylase domain-containing protein [Bacteroidia bacterium]|nr:transglycosylase domain-containing protein [Bacteroidia bacterium]MDW8347821.1 transglycosylase domain-containing protein [Bacteroidia bacterium]